MNLSAGAGRPRASGPLISHSDQHQPQDPLSSSCSVNSKV